MTAYAEPMKRASKSASAPARSARDVPQVALCFWSKGVGMAWDARILSERLRRAGCRVIQVRTRNRENRLERRWIFARQLLLRRFRPYDLQVHVAQIHREQFRFSSRNLIVTNPDFTDPEVFPRLPANTVLAAKTHHALGLFGQSPLKTEYTGFSSDDRFSPEVRKDFRSFLHLAGMSSLKGTRHVLELWRRHPEWPKLTVVWAPVDIYGKDRRLPAEAAPNIELVQEHLPEARVRELQNRCGVHLCPSETEGFGHYIMEALSTGALVLTTDAPPMNELVDPSFAWRVAATSGRKQFMNTCYQVDLGAFEAAVEGVLALDPDAARERSGRARDAYLSAQSDFHERLDALLARMLS